MQGGLHDAEMESSYKFQGFLDVNGDGEKELIYTNDESERWVTAEVDNLTGQIDFDENGNGGSTRVVGKDLCRSLSYLWSSGKVWWSNLIVTT